MPDWGPSASQETLRLRANMLATIRQFFAQRSVLEVDTPMLSVASTTDPYLESFPVADGARMLFLQTSPEFAMKRLLAAGSGSIYQLAHAFRREEQGRLHNREFMLLEWYRTGFGERDLMLEVDTLVRQLLAPYRRLQPSESLSYGAAFQRYLGLDIHTASATQLASCAQHLGLSVNALDAPQALWRDLLLTHAIEPKLGQDRLTFLYDYPAEAAALARIRPGPPEVAARFELYLDGVELANGYDEERDAGVLRSRFESQVTQRRAQGLPAIPIDEYLLAAMTAGLPACSGVAVGVDRLLMCALQLGTLAEVLAFPAGRC